MIKEEIYKIYDKKTVFFTSTINNIGIDILKKRILELLKEIEIKTGNF